MTWSHTLKEQTQLNKKGTQTTVSGEKVRRMSNSNHFDALLDDLNHAERTSQQMSEEEPSENPSINDELLYSNCKTTASEGTELFMKSSGHIDSACFTPARSGIVNQHEMEVPLQSTP